jgi:hypothetical protein
VAVLIAVIPKIPSAGSPAPWLANVRGGSVSSPSSAWEFWLSAVSCGEKQKGAKNFRTEGFKDLKELTLTISPSDRHSLWLEVLAGV